MLQPDDLIVDDPVGVRQELARLGIDVELVRAVAFAAAAAKADTLPIDAASAPGAFAYYHGVRQKRLQLLRRDGWRPSTIDNIEATVNDERGVQFVFQNVDRACTSKDPSPRSPKGPAARRLISDGQQGELFGASTKVVPIEPVYGQAPTVWLICVSADESSFQAEVSCPKVFDGKEFNGFSKRIWVVDESYTPDPSYRLEQDLPELDFDVVVTRK